MEIGFDSIPLGYVLENTRVVLLKVNEKSCEKCLHWCSTVI